MRAFGLVVAALLGGFFGYVATAMVAMPILRAGGGIADGSAAMGAMLVVAPIGAIVGALVGFFFALVATRHKSAGPGRRDIGGGAEPADNAPGEEPARIGSRSNQPLIALGIMAAIVAGIYFSLFYEYTPPHFPVHGRKPNLLFEVRVPTAAIAEDDFFDVKAELRSWQNSISPDRRMKRTEDGDTTVFSGAVPMYNKVDDRKFFLWPSQKIFIEFNLPIAAHPQDQPEFSDWREADKIEIYPSMNEVYKLTRPEATIRTRVQWPQ